MCLITSIKKPFIAKKDIVVYKRLVKGYYDNYVTPHQETFVTLNSVLHAKGKHEISNADKQEIRSGFVHAYLSKNKYLSSRYILFKSIIPKGTKFYISDDLAEVCAKEMFITDEKVKYGSLPPVEERVKELYKDYLSGLFEEKEINGQKIEIGYLCLSDKTFVKPDGNIYGKKIIGIVGDITDENKIIVTSLDEERLRWSDKYEMVGCYSADGKVNTKKIRDLKDRKEGDYPIFDWVDNYVTEGTEKGNWYIGSETEVKKVISLNQMLVNIGLAMSSVGVQLYVDNSYWSSSEYNSNSVRFVDMCNSYVDNYNKYGANYVRAFLKL